MRRVSDTEIDTALDIARRAHECAIPVNGAATHRSEIEAPAAPGFSVTRIGDVQDEGPPRWLVDGLWLEEGVGVIGGEPKSYKSFVSAQLAVCVASGKPMFGRHEVKRGRVLMFNAEDRPAMTRHRIKMMCTALDVDIATLDVHLISVPALRLDDAEQVELLRATVAAVQPQLLILDPLRDLHGLDENDARIVSALLSPLRVIQREFKTAVMVVHHMAKLGETQRRAGQRLRGSSALHGWIDSALYLTHKEGAVVVEPEHRSAKSSEKFRFRVLEAETQTGPALWLESQSDEDEEVKQEKNERREMTENAIIACIAAATEPLTGRDIRRAVKGRAELIVEAVRSLVNSGVLAEETVIRGGREAPGYSISKERRHA